MICVSPPPINNKIVRLFSKPERRVPGTGEADGLRLLDNQLRLDDHRHQLQPRPAGGAAAASTAAGAARPRGHARVPSPDPTGAPASSLLSLEVRHLLANSYLS